MAQQQLAWLVSAGRGQSRRITTFPYGEPFLLKSSMQQASKESEGTMHCKHQRIGSQRAFDFFEYKPPYLLSSPYY
jgi:hypothetical protein